jgi:hypothetical protein
MNIKRAPLVIIVVVALILSACNMSGTDVPTTRPPTKAPPTATTPPSVSEACDEALALAASGVLSGAGVPGSSGYSGDEPHRVVVIQPDGKPHSSCAALPASWGARQIAETALVAVVGEPDLIQVQRCTFQDGAPDVVRLVSELTVVLYEAATGAEVSQVTLRGSAPRACNSTEVYGLTSLAGEPVSDQQIVEWLEDFTAVPRLLMWSRAPFETQAGGSVRSVTAGGPGLVAVGTAFAGEEKVAAVWVSVDGSAWEQVAHDEAVFGGPGNQVMNSVAAGDQSLVAVGYQSVGEERDAAVWWSQDGLLWSRLPHDDLVFGGLGQQEMVSVVVGGPGLVAVGSDSSGGQPAAAVWVSCDGMTWSRVPDVGGALSGSDWRWMEAVTVGGPGLVAVGKADGAAAVWVSVDGLDWERIPHDEELFGSPGTPPMSGVASSGPGLVAVGAFNSKAAVWVSADGLVWERLPHDEELFGCPTPGAGEKALQSCGPTEMIAVTAGGPGLVAIGVSEVNYIKTAVVWVSADGFSWSRVRDDGQVFSGDMASELTVVTAVGVSLVAFGSYDGEAVVWVGLPPD